MIVGMKKIMILCMQSRRDAALEALRELGVLHVMDVQKPSGDNIETVEERLARVARAVKLLEGADYQAHQENPPSQAVEMGKGELTDHVLNIADQREHAEQQLKMLRHEVHRTEPLGEFAPEQVLSLRSQGLELKLRELPKGDSLETPQGLSSSIVGHLGGNMLVAYSGRAADFPEELPGKDFVVPKKALSELRRLLSEQEDRIEQSTRELAALALQAGPLRDWMEELREEREFYHVREGMGEAETVAYLQGYCPVTKVEALEQAAAENGWGLVVRDPDPEDEPPTLIDYPRWVKPIKAVFDFLQIQPGYREADISLTFLVFFSIFFGILIGDAGYGLMIVVGTFLTRMFFRKGPGYAYNLMYLLGGLTTLWGTMTGDFFGISDLPAPLASLRVEWLSLENPDSSKHIMHFSFLIGAIHLTIAHVWNIIAIAPRPRFLEQLGWAMLVWVMYFAATAMVLQKTFPTFAYGLLIVGLVLIILFMTPVKKLKEDWILHIMLPLNVVACFVDLVSYVRLFAVGLASFSVASSFNDMALMAGFGNIVSGFFAVLILVFGHVLNIILCALAILVHGVRLNTLEFSLHKDLQWAGYPYRPFTRSNPEKVD